MGVIESIVDATVRNPLKKKKEERLNPPVSSNDSGDGVISSGVKGFVKGASGLDDEARKRLFPERIPNSAKPGLSDVSGLQAAEAKAGVRLKVPMGSSTNFNDSKSGSALTATPSSFGDKVNLRKGATLGSGMNITQDSSGNVVLVSADGTKADPSKTRLSGGNLGGTPLPAGQSPFFIKSEAAKGLTQPQPQTGIPGVTQAPGAVPGSMGSDWTGIMNQETAMLNSVANPNLKPGQYQDFSKSIGMNGTPGGDSAFRSIESQIADLTNMNKQLMGGYGQSVEMGRMSKRKRDALWTSNTEQITKLNESLTGRSTLANDLVKALLQAQTTEKTTGMTNAAGLDQERIKAGAGNYQAEVNAGATHANAQQKDLQRQDEKAKADRRWALGKAFDKYTQQKKEGLPFTPEEEEEFANVKAQLSAMYADNPMGLPDEEETK
jgi:hypothetical protein